MRYLCLFVLAGSAFAQDPLEIVRKSVNRDQNSWELAKDYTYIVRSKFTERDSSGNPKKVRVEASEVSILYGEPYEKKIEKDGKPLSPAEERKEHDKLDKLAAKRQRESEAERSKRLASFEKGRREEREFAKEIPEAYTFRLRGEEVVNDHKTWVVDATPREGYRPKLSHAGVLKKFKATLWIDQKEYHWVKLEGEAIDTVSWGLFLARIAKGSKFTIEQARVNEEVWMPKHVRVDFDARLALLKRMQADVDVRFENFRKFSSESKIVSTAEAVPNP